MNGLAIKTCNTKPKTYIDQLLENAVDDKLVSEMLPKTASDHPNNKVVYKYLLENYPKETLYWVIHAEWKLEEVPLNQIQMSRRPGGAREMDKVKNIAKAVNDGKKMDPVILVNTPNGDKLKVADGYHRTLGFKHAEKKSIKAWVGKVTKENGPWDKEMHEKKLNVGKTANELSLGLDKEAALPLLGRAALSLGKGIVNSTVKAGKSLSGANVAKTQMTKNKVLKNPVSSPQEIKDATKAARNAKLGMAGSWGALGVAGAGGAVTNKYNEQRQQKYDELTMQQNQQQTVNPYKNTLNP